MSGTIVATGSEAELDTTLFDTGDMTVTWTQERLEPVPSPIIPLPIALIEEARSAYVDGEAERCLAILAGDDLDDAVLLERGYRAEASDVAVLRASCFFDRDEARARDELERLFVRELPAENQLSRTNQNVQSLAVQARAFVLAQTRVQVVVESAPSGSSAQVDGGSHSCDSTPCTFQLLPGEHVFVVEQLGYVRELHRAETIRAATIRIGLSDLGPDQARAELAHHFASGQRIDASIAPLIQRAYDSDFVALLRIDSHQSRASLFNRQGAILGEGAASRVQAGAEGRAIQAALDDWQGARETSERGIRRPWLAWVVSLSIVAVAGGSVGLYYATRPPSHILAF